MYCVSLGNLRRVVRGKSTIFTNKVEESRRRGGGGGAGGEEEEEEKKEN